MRYISTLINLFAFSSLLHVNDAHDGSRRISLSHPEDVGLGHTQIISNLQESIRASTPNNAKQFLQALATEMINTICEPHDQDCHQLMIHTTLSTVPHYTDHMQHITSILPDGFDSHVLSSLDRLFSTVSSMSSDTHESTVQMIDRDLHDLKHSEIVEEELHRDIGIMAYSVGLESMKQWREVLDDEDNPFHKMNKSIESDEENNDHSRFRSLQFLPEGEEEEGGISDEDFSLLIQSDIVGAVDGAVNGLFSGNVLFLQIGLANSVKDSALKYAELFVNDIGPDEDGCFLPDSIFCNNGVKDDDFDDDYYDSEDDCLFPDSPLCGSGVSNVTNEIISNPEESELPCLLPQIQNCSQ